MKLQYKPIQYLRSSVRNTVWNSVFTYVCDSVFFSVLNSIKYYRIGNSVATPVERAIREEIK